MKYTNLSNQIGNIFLKILCILGVLSILAVMGLVLYVELTIEEASFFMSMMWIILLPTCGLGINRLIGLCFGDRYYNTGMVHEGHSIYDVEKTPQFYSRTMFFCFIECILFVILLIRYIFLIPINIVGAIVGIVCAIIATIIFYIVGMSCYEQSSIRQNKAFKSSAKIYKRTSKKFKFNKYPDILDKFNHLQQCGANKDKTYSHDKMQVEKDRAEAFDALALAIYDIFNDIQPDLTIKKTGEIVLWQDVINRPFSELDYMEKLILVRLLDRLYKYVLPDKYYED